MDNHGYPWISMDIIGYIIIKKNEMLHPLAWIGLVDSLLSFDLPSFTTNDIQCPWLFKQKKTRAANVPGFQERGAANQIVCHCNSIAFMYWHL